MIAGKGPAPGGLRKNPSPREPSRATGATVSIGEASSETTGNISDASPAGCALVWTDDATIAATRATDSVLGTLLLGIRFSTPRRLDGIEDTFCECELCANPDGKAMCCSAECWEPVRFSSSERMGRCATNRTRATASENATQPISDASKGRSFPSSVGAELKRRVKAVALSFRTFSLTPSRLRRTFLGRCPEIKQQSRGT